jgi:hypothetical protein
MQYTIDIDITKYIFFLYQIYLFRIYLLMMSYCYNFSNIKDKHLTYRGSVRYVDVINYGRGSKAVKVNRTCVMCGKCDGKDGCSIPTQNKDVCKTCDKVFWHVLSSDCVLKFCKGCKVCFKNIIKYG